MAQADAPSTMTRLRSATNFMASRGVFQGHDDRAIQQAPRVFEHIAKDHLTADAIHEGRRVVHGARFAGGERCGQRRGGLHFGGVDLDVRRELAEHRRDPAGEAAAAPGNHHGVQVRKVFEQFQGDGAVAGHHVEIVEGVDEGGLDAGVGAGFEGAPPVGERREDDAPAQAFDGADFGGGRGIGRDDGGGHADAARAERDALRHVAGGRSQHAAIEEMPRSPRHDVGGAADLEGADRLEVLELQPEARRANRRNSGPAACAGPLPRCWRALPPPGPA